VCERLRCVITVYNRGIRERRRGLQPRKSQTQTDSHDKRARHEKCEERERLGPALGVRWVVGIALVQLGDAQVHQQGSSNASAHIVRSRGRWQCTATYRLCG